MKIKQTLPVVATTVLLLVSAQASAAGFAIIENSASGMGNSFAGGAASAEDASTIWFNPAGMTRLGNEMMTAAHIIAPTASYTDTDSLSALGGQLDPTNTDRTAEGGKNAVIPNLYWVNEIQKDLKIGVGISVPFGLGTEYDDDWVGRYHAVKSDVMSLNINPSIAYKSGDVSLGFGINALYMHVELSSAIDMASVCQSAFPASSCTAWGDPQGNDGFADLSADGWAYGYNFGVLYEMPNDIRVGFAYRSAIDHSVKGDADFTVPGDLDFLLKSGSFLDTTLKGSVSLPATTSISYFQNINEEISIMADYSLTSWGTFEELRIDYASLQDDSVTTEEWVDSARISFGLNYKQSADLLIRFGLALDETPIPSADRRTPRIPGNDRTWISAGLTYQIDKDRSFSFGYAHLFVDDTKIKNKYETNVDNPVPEIEHTLTGTYKASVDIISAQVSWKY